MEPRRGTAAGPAPAAGPYPRFELDATVELEDLGDNLSPADTSALAWAHIHEVSQRKCNPGARGLNGFLNGAMQGYTTPNGDARTNVIDQGERKTYALPPDYLRQLFGYLDTCRREGSITHFSERQGTVASPRSGIMLDYDVVTTTAKPAWSDRLYHRIASTVVAELHKDLDLLGGLMDANRGKTQPSEAKVQVFFIVKPEAVLLSPARLQQMQPRLQPQPQPQPPPPQPQPQPAAAAPAEEAGTAAAAAAAPAPEPAAGGGAEPAEAAEERRNYYKYGFHVLIPGVMVERAYKKWLLRNLRESAAIAAVLAELGAVGDLAACLDLNSASVPVLYFGSCKRGGTPYVLGAALEAAVSLGEAEPQPPAVTRFEYREAACWNLVAELSLAAEATYEDGRAPLIRKVPYACRPELAAAVTDWAQRTLGGATAAGELLFAENELALLTVQDPDARDLHGLLDLLTPPYYTEYARWRDVVFALANTSDRYLPLARWFSQKCPEKWAAGGAAALDKLWAEAVARAAAGGGAGRPLTKASISYWAQECDPGRCAEVKARSYYTILMNYVYAYGGALEHFMIAKALHSMVGTKYAVDIAPGVRGAETYCWYEFVLPGQAMRPGETWKWRREVEPDALHLYMSERMGPILDQVAEHLEERRERAPDEERAKYYKRLGENFAKSRAKLFNDQFKNGVVRQSNYIFRRRGFCEQLDRIPWLFGVANGVLKLGAKCQLIDHFHEYPISRYTPVAYVPFDPDRPMTRVILRALEDIWVEPDVRDFVLFQAAQSLDGHPKEGLLLLLEGGGQNGKTTFLRWVAKALGPYAEKFNIQLMSSDREDADKPNSAMMRFKHIQYGYAEESNKSTVLNTARMKEMINTGEVSGRDLNSKQETFTMKANITIASQYSFLILTRDHGTWRRILHYTNKTRFRQHPDPSNPLEKKEDQRMNNQYSNDPEFLSCFLSLLVHYYERLQTEYGGELKNVRSPTIQTETEAYRVSQDSLHRWISECIVLSPKCEDEYTLGVLSSYYADWYLTNIDNRRLTASDTIKEIENSLLNKYLRPAPNNSVVLRGCRVLLVDPKSGSKGSPAPGEEFITAVEMRGRRTAEEWKEAVAAAEAHARQVATARGGGDDRWWEPAGARQERELREAAAAAAAERADALADVAGLVPADDDAALMRATAPPPAAPADRDRDRGLMVITDEMLEDLLVSDQGRRQRAIPLTIDDVFPENRAAAAAAAAHADDGDADDDDADDDGDDDDGDVDSEGPDGGRAPVLIGGGPPPRPRPVIVTAPA